MREQCGIAFQNGTLARTGNIDLRAGKSGPQHPSVLYKHKYPRSQGKVLAPIALRSILLYWLALCPCRGPSPLSGLCEPALSLEAI